MNGSDGRTPPRGTTAAKTTSCPASKSTANGTARDARERGLRRQAMKASEATATRAIVDRRTAEATSDETGSAGSDGLAGSIEGAALLDEVHAMLAKFIVFPSPENLDAVTLWVVHTHALDMFETTPRLALLSPEPGSGKTRVLEILEMLVLRPQLTVNVSPAYLFRKVADEDGPPTILYDEIDTVFGAKARENEDIRGMLNAGYRRGATAGRCKVVGKVVETEELPAFAAVALAGLNDRRLPDTLLSRCIVVKMRRRAPGEDVEPYRRRTHEREGHALRGKVVTWVGSVRAQLDGVYPDLPAEITDRNADVWEPLIAIADAAGGSWPERARGSAVAAVAASQGDRGGAGVDLLRDTRTVFGVDDYVTTAVLLDRLYDLEESQWNNYREKPLDARVLSEMLGDYEIGPDQKKIGKRNTRGYERYKFEDAWTRYLPPLSSEESDTSDTDSHIEDTPAPSPEKSATGATSATAEATRRTRTSVVGKRVNRISRSVLTRPKSSRKSTSIPKGELT